MKTKLVLCLFTAALAFASAKSYWVDLNQPAMAGNTELKAGQYRVELENQKAVIVNGKVRVELPVTVGTTEKKFSGTSVILSQGNGKPQILEIHLGGTSTKLVFGDEHSDAANR